MSRRSKRWLLWFTAGAATAALGWVLWVLVGIELRDCFESSPSRRPS